MLLIAALVVPSVWIGYLLKKSTAPARILLIALLAIAFVLTPGMYLQSQYIAIVNRGPMDGGVAPILLLLVPLILFGTIVIQNRFGWSVTGRHRTEKPER